MKSFFRSRIFLLLITYLLLLLIFVLQKPVFLLYHLAQSAEVGISGWADIMAAGFSMDLSVAGYFTVVPALLLLLSVFFTKGLKIVLKIYFVLVSILIAIIFVPDIVLYSYWGFRIDSTVFAYITSPAEAAASTPLYVTILVVLCTLLYALLVYAILNKCIINNFPKKTAEKKVSVLVAIVISLGLLFVAIRGGVTTSTMNVSRAYFSSDTFMNHAAINPVFNMFYSMKLKDDFRKQFRFMPDNEAKSIFEKLMEHDPEAPFPHLLTTNRPNIIFILLESFGAPVIESLGGAEDVAPNINRLSAEGVFFTSLYANSFRTDRGVVAAWAGFPAQPNMSLLKYTNKMQNLPSIPHSLIENGYATSFLYGGDVNFAQIKTLFSTQGVTDITGDTDFPLNMRLTKWGVPDAYTFERLYADIEKEKKEPYLKMFLTLSSHEPFDVPTSQFDEPYFNSVHYADSCLGLFIDKLKASPQWENTLVVLMPDHNMRYPHNIGHYDPARHHSFMLWLGGAVKEPYKVDRLCSQVDAAATLLSQLDIDTKPFVFSKNILNPTVKPFAFYTFPNGFTMIADSGRVSYDSDGRTLLLNQGLHTDSLLLQGEAFLQRLYDYIDSK